MKNLLIPTDFSDAARNAFHYAMKLLPTLQPERVTLAHVFLPETTGQADFIPPVAEIMKSRQDMLQSFHDELKESYGSFPCPVEPEVLVGFPADEVVKASEDHDLIVMGSTGQSGLLERLFGSVSSSVSQRAYCPVILVPAEAEFQPYKHLLFASRYDEESRATIEQLTAFNRPFNAHLHFVHVKESDDKAQREQASAIFEELFENGEPPFSFDITEIEGSSVAEALSGYAQEHGVQLVVMATRHRGFWGNIVHRSQTKRMALTTDVPLMVLHVDVAG